MRYVLHFGASVPMKLIRRMAGSMASSGSMKRPLSPPSSIHAQNGLRNRSLSVSPTRRRSSLTRVPASPFPHHGHGAKKSKTGAGGELKKAYIALGSNMGDRVALIEHACNELTARGIKVTRTSSLWETKPMYVLDQDSFVNGACEVETTLEPLALLDQLQEVENFMGRKKVIDKGPRNIDLDILLYEDHVIEHERLSVPHIGIPEREFVLKPLAELIPHKAIYASQPWKITQDFLNALPPSINPISTMTPLGKNLPALHALRSNRKTHVMAILNVTPDSFSDGGKHTATSLNNTIDKFIASGITIFDVGGQSSAPGTPEVPAAEEKCRVLPAIAAIRAHPRGNEIAISVDTYRASVAQAAIEAGADIVNDVSAGQMDKDMLATVAKLGCTICLMHMRGTPATMKTLTDYPQGLIPTIASELLERVAEAEAAGIRRWRIILDPGIGFAKTSEQNLEILRRMEELREWPGLAGLPWLVGSSRKAFIGKITGVKEPVQRIWGTAATVVAAVQGGADIVRVHDAEEMGSVVKMSDAIWRV